MHILGVSIINNSFKMYAINAISSAVILDGEENVEIRYKLFLEGDYLKEVMG